jgi:N-acetylneuraminic acid mutarotase
MRYSPLRSIRYAPLAGVTLLALSGLLLGEPLATGWSNGPDLPVGLVRATGVYFPANGRFYAMGGRMSDAFGADMTTPCEYNPKTNTWAYKTAPFPDNQVCNMACGVLTDRGTPCIYCVGGTAADGSRSATTRVFRYNPVTDTMQTVGIDPWNESTPNTLPGGFTVFQNKLYLVGGLTLGNSGTNRIFEFTPGNPVGSQWKQKRATLPESLGFLPVAAIGNLIFTAGGSRFQPCSLLETDHSYVYDPVADTIAPIKSIPRTTGETRAVAVDGEMWVLGGGRASASRSTEVNIYNPSTGEWRVGPPLNTGLRNFAAASDGHSIFIAGGYDSAATPLKTTLIYHAKSGSGAGTNPEPGAQTAKTDQ